MSEPISATPSRSPGLVGWIAHRLAGDPVALPIEGHLPSFDGATGWLDSPPLMPEGLRGRVVLVDFWTYTCVNWLRTLPYLRAWAGRYAEQGLTVIGVHTPEFDFEHDVDNVVAQARALRVPYPIALDNGYRVWRAFANHFWPAIYLTDAQGRIRYHHFGEGEYAMTEVAIQQLLSVAGAAIPGQGLVPVDPHGLEVAADYESLRSPETYLATARRPASPHPTAYAGTSRTSTRRRGGSASTPGQRRGHGRSRPARLCWPRPAVGSPSGSRPVTSTS